MESIIYIERLHISKEKRDNSVAKTQPQEWMEEMIEEEIQVVINK